MGQIRQIAIIGGGPAGSLCGERLARSGFEVTIYDEHLAWEMIPRLKAANATGIVEYPLNKVVM